MPDSETIALNVTCACTWAGRAFPDEAAALEKRYGGNLYPSLYRPEPTSDDLSESERLEIEGADLT
jgi:hypothetical protein